MGCFDVNGRFPQGKRHCAPLSGTPINRKNALGSTGFQPPRYTWRTEQTLLSAKGTTTSQPSPTGRVKDDRTTRELKARHKLLGASRLWPMESELCADTAWAAGNFTL